MKTPVVFSDLITQLMSVSTGDDLSVALNTPYLIVDTEGWQQYRELAAIDLQQPNCPVITIADTDTEVPSIIDLVATSEAEFALLTSAIDSNPAAATILVQLLRHNEVASVGDGLFAESLSYSTLQHGEVFTRWLSDRSSGKEVQETEVEDRSTLVLMERDGDKLSILLNRPGKRNAYSAALRDAFYEALVVAADDPSIERVVVRGAGKNFSAGGDLDEFGSARDAATAHVSRLTRSNGALLHRLRSKTEFHLHGACIGAGIELPSFSDRVVALEDSFFQLPEVSMGLIPGAGGTVSIPRRIGRIRTAFMAISNQRISSQRALEWGLIDSIL